MNNELSNLEEWFKCTCSKLSLNIAKINYMIITMKNLPSVLPNLYMCGDVINSKRNVKFLALFISNNMN